MGIWVRLLFLLFSLCAGPALSDEFTDPEVDIDDEWLGAAVSAQFGDEDAVHDYDGVIDSFVGTPITFTDGMGPHTVSDGSLSASVVGAGNGIVRSKAGIYYHPADGGNLGTSSQSLKPFIVEGNGTITTSIDISFDGLMVVDEQSADADAYSQARVGYQATIEHLETIGGIQERAEVEGQSFDGTAWLRQQGNGAAPTVIVPEQDTLNDQGATDNSWYNNNNLVIRKVVAAGAGAGEINLGDLTGNTNVEAAAHLGAGRNVYYLTYNQTFTFDAVGGDTYYVKMDLFTAVDASSTDDNSFTNDAFAVSDFSNTINYDLSGGNGITTALLIDGAQSIPGNNAFGGANSRATLDDATLTLTGNAALAEKFILTDGTSNTINTNGNTGSISGVVSGTGALVKSGAGTLTLSGNNSYSGGTTISGGTLQVSGNNILPTSGNINVGSGATLDINNTTQTIDGLSGAGTISLGGGTIITGGMVAPGNSIGTLTVNGGSYTQATGSSFEVEFNDAGNTDLLDVTAGGVTIQAGVTLVPVALDSIAAMRNYTFLSTTGGITGTFDTVEDNFAVLDFSLAKINAGNDYQLTVNRESYASAASGAATSGVAGTLDTLLAGAPPAEVQTIMNALDVMSVSEINEAYAALSPNVTGAAATGASAVTGQIQNIISGRTATVRSGRSGGDDLFTDRNAWVQGFYGIADQEDRGGVRGYDADSTGFAMGVDAGYTEQWRLGIAYGYGHTNSRNSISGLDADGHTGMVYGTYDGRNWYVDGMASLGWYDYESRRYTVAGTAGADYQGYQVAIRADAGLPMALGSRLTFTPVVTTRYSYFASESYQEAGAPGANLAVDSDSSNLLTMGLGGRLSSDFAGEGGWIFSPSGRAGLTYDVVRDDIASTARFVSAGPAFTTRGLKPARTALEMGVGATFSGPEGLDVLVNYDGELRSDYLGHSGIVRLRQSF